MMRCTLLRWAWLLISIVGCAGVPTDHQRALFSEAESAFSEANSREDFLQVAAVYQQLLDQGFQSAAVHFNQGLAYLEADETARAIAALRHAQQLQPRNDAIAIALARAGASARPVTTRWYEAWLHTVQDFLSAREKCWALTAILVATSLVGLWAARYRTWRVVGWITALGAVPIVTLLISISWDIQAMRHPAHGVVLNDAVGRRGPAELHAAVWPKQVAAGTEVVVREQRRNWVRVLWPAHGDAWLPTKDVILY